MITEKTVAYQQYVKTAGNTKYQGYLVLTDGKRIVVPAHLLDLCKLTHVQRN